jgi:hypothetical protein
MKTRVFISLAIPFDFETRNQIVRESLRSDSAFTVSGWSERLGDFRDEWEDDTRRQIEDSDLVVVLVSAYTGVMSTVREEVSMAQALGKAVLGVDVDGDANPPENVEQPVPLADALQQIRSYHQ